MRPEQSRRSERPLTLHSRRSSWPTSRPARPKVNIQHVHLALTPMVPKEHNRVIPLGTTPLISVFL